MEWQFTTIFYTLILTTALTIAVFGYIASKPYFYGKLPFVMMLCSMSIWALFSALEVAAPTQQLKILMTKFSYVGIISAPVFYLYFVLQFTGFLKGRLKSWIPLIWGLPFMTLGLVITNERHALIWTGFHFMETQNILVYQHGVWFFIGIFYLMGVTLLGSLILVFFITPFSEKYRKQVYAMTIGASFPLLTSFLYVTGLNPFSGFDISPLGLALAALSIGIGLGKMHLFDFLPIARSLVFEKMIDGIIVLDTNGTILDINRSVQKMGLLTHRAIGGRASELIPEIYSVLDFKNLKPTEVRVETSREYWLEVLVNPIDDPNSGRLGYLLELRIITRRKKSELALLEVNQKLKESEALQQEIIRQKDKFFSIIAHDLRNPFNALLGLTEVLEEEWHSLDDDEKLKMVILLRGSSKNAHELLDNLLEWSRAQLNRIDYMPQEIALGEITTSAINKVQLQSEGKNISIRSEVDLGALATLDPDMIETVLRNLLTNAIKFSHPGSTVTLSGEVKNSEVILKVADQGVGMSESQIDSLFRIDVKNSHPGTQGEKGTGLGLLLIKEFVQKHNGTIEIRSEPDKGSTFIIRLPQSIQTEDNSANQAKT